MAVTAAARAAWNSFASPDELAERLADRIAAILQGAVEQRGQATLAVSGGRTPERLFSALSRRDIAWGKIVVTLVDERFVPHSDSRSNARLVAEKLCVANAAAASFVSLYRPAANVEEAARFAELSVAGLPRPFDVVVLGMGADGHAASFFPDAPDLEELLENRDRRSVLPVVAASAGEPRLTQSLQLLCAARFIALHIEGEEKKRVLREALEERNKPVSAFFDHAENGVQVYWTP